MAKKPARRAARAMPSPPTGQPKTGSPNGSGNQAYPEPTGPSNINLGLNATTHNGSDYPQPNSANSPDPASSAPPAPVPGPEAYNPSLAGDTLSSSVSIPGLQSGKQPPKLPLSPSSAPKGA